MATIDGVGLVLVNDAGHTFHVDGDVHPHGGLLRFGVWSWTVEIE
jgi:hypothetical protein